MRSSPPQSGRPPGRTLGRRLRALLVVCALVVPAVPLLAAVSAGSAAAEDNGLAATPPMGWNNYNAYGNTATATLIEQTACRHPTTTGCRRPATTT